MNTFLRHKSVEEIKAQCEAQGLTLSTEKYDQGGDHIKISSSDGEAKAEVLFSVFNGRFFGTTDKGQQFSSDEKLDGTPWFDALLEFFYVRKTD